MTDFNHIDDVDAFCSKLYSGDKNATLSVTSEGWRGVVDRIGLPLLQAVLQQSTSAYSIIFVSRAASECLESLFSDVAQLTQFALSVYDLLRIRDAELNAAAKLALRQLVCATVQRGYRHSPTLAQMPSAVCTSCMSAITRESELGSFQVGCEVLTDLVATFGERRMATFASDVSVAKSFRDEHLISIFDLAVEGIKTIPPMCRSASNAALRLLLQVLEFDFSCDSIGEGEEDAITRNYPDSWAAHLVDVSLLERLWDLYRVENIEVDAVQGILEAITILISLRQSLFTDVEVRQRWIEMALLQTHIAMERRTHMDDEESLKAFARLLNRIKPNCELNELIQLSVFPRWMDSCLGFTKQCFANWRHASTAILSLLSMWSRLVEAKSYTKYDTTTLLNGALQVVHMYLGYMRSRVQVYTADLEKSMRNDANGAKHLSCSHIDYALDDDKEGVRLEMEFVMKLVMSSGIEAWRALEANAEYAAQALLSQIRPDTSTLTADHILAVEEGAWSLHLLSGALQADGVLDSGSVHILAMLLHGLMQMNRISSRAPCVGHLPHDVMGHFAEASTQVLSSILAKTVSVYVQSNRKTSAFVEQLTNRLRQCSEIDTTTTFAVYFLNVAVHTLWVLLSLDNVPPEVRIDALKVLDEWTSTPSILRSMRETRSYHLLLNLSQQAMPLPLQDAALLRGRYLFVRVVAQVRFLDSSSLTDSVINTLISPLLVRISELLYSPSRDNAANALQLKLMLNDLRGIFSCAERRPYRALLDIFDPTLSSLANCVFERDVDGTAALTQLLQLVGEITLNKSQRIVFGPHSTRPVQLFHFASQVTIRAARLCCTALSGPATAEADTSDPLFDLRWKQLRLTLTLGQHILQGGLCNLGLLQFYQDASLRDTLGSIWTLLRSVQYTDCLTRPKVGVAVIKMVGVLATRFFHWFWAEQPPLEVFALVGLVEALAFPSNMQQSDAALQAEALQTMERLVNCCWVRTTYPKEEETQAAAMRAVLLQCDPIIFHRLTTCCLERSVAAENHAVRKLLLPLFYVEGPAFGEVAQYFCSRGTTPEAVQVLQEQFTDIQRQLATPGDVTTDTMHELQNALQSIVDLLRRHV